MITTQKVSEWFVQAMITAVIALAIGTYNSSLLSAENSPNEQLGCNTTILISNQNIKNNLNLK